MSDPVHYGLIVAAKAAIQALGLEEIGTSRVHERLLPTDRGITPPAVVVSLWDKEELPAFGTEESDRKYPVVVTFLMVKNQDLALKKPELAWREKVLTAFQYGLPGAPEVWNVTVEPQPIVDLRLFLDAQLFCGAILFRFWVAKRR